MAENEGLEDVIVYDLRLDSQAEIDGDTDFLKLCENHILARAGAKIVFPYHFILGFMFTMPSKEFKRLKWNDPKWKDEKGILRVSVKKCKDVEEARREAKSVGGE